MGTFRFLLAMSVTLGHFGTVWGYHIMNGRMAVQCFFMISGFLISLVLSQKYDPGTADGRALFYTNRALRIFVPYWSFCLMILLAHALIYLTLDIRFGADAALAQHWPEMTPVTRIYLLFSNVFILTQEWSMWLVYQTGAMIPVWSSDLHSPHLGSLQVIPQAWSISLELMFYAIAPFLLRRHWLVLLAIIVATYISRSVLAAYGLNGSGFVYRFFPLEIGLFLAGALSHRVYAYVSARCTVPFGVCAITSSVLLGLVLVQQYVDRLDNHQFYLLVALALPSLFEVSRRIRFDSWLGELSYPIYLAHVSVLSAGQVVATALIGQIEDRSLLVLAMAAATVLVAIAYVYWIDAPFERWRQHRRAKPKAPSAEALGQVRPTSVAV